MHGHMPQQHPGLHPAHQPPPHLTHMANLPPHSMPRDHPANRLNTARHRHPRAVDHQAAAGMAPHLPMQLQPPPPHQPHQPQNPRKPGPPYYATNGGIHGGMPKPLPLTTTHMHPPPGLNPQQMGPRQQQHPGPMPLQTVVNKLPYGMGVGGGMGQHGKQPMQQHQQHQHQPPVSVHHSVAMAPPVQAPIPVVSAATPAGTKTRHIPSSTDHKTHHHNQHTMQANGSSAPGSKGAMHNQTAIPSGSTMAKSKSAIGGGVRHQQQQQTPAKLADSAASKDTDRQHLPVATSAPVGGAAIPVPATDSTAMANPTQTDGTSASSVNTTAGSTTVPSKTVANAGTTAEQSTALTSSNSLETLANIKEKTTMCLVNELARYNKIQHQYRLTGESGPAHKKRFTVTLKLGDEEYTAEGASIKKAQHKAAGDAIAATKYKHPPARTKPRSKTGPRGNVSSFTPTVELNALAMKRGEPTVYQVKAVPMPASKYPATSGMPSGAAPGRRTGGDKLTSSVGNPPSSAHGLGMSYGGASGRYGHSNGGDASATGATPTGGSYWGRGAGMTGVVAGVGGRGGMGGFHPGHQQQQQHHHAHHPRAGGQDDQHGHLHHHHHLHGQLHHHSHLHHDASYGHPPGSLMPVQEFYKATLRVGERTFLGEGHSPQAARHDAAARALEVLKPLTAEGAEGKGRSAGSGDEQANEEDGASDGADGDPNADLKSPISLVHEMAVQRNVPVVFEVISEKGPPHMTVFVTQCKVGTIVTEGEGTGKKPSKKRAAEKMLDELRKLQKAEQQSSYAPWGGEAGASEKRRAHPKVSSTTSHLESGVGMVKKKARNLIKEQSMAGEQSEKENPISRLMQIQQARKEKQPVYTLVENERANVGRRRQFTIEVSAGGKKASGIGMTKKAAKWNAAEALLVELGYAADTKKPAGPNVSNSNANKENQPGAANEAPPTITNGSRKFVFVEGTENGRTGSSKPPNGTDSRTPLSGGNQGVAPPHGNSDPAKDSMNDSTASNDSVTTNSSGVSSAASLAPTVAAPPPTETSPSAPSNPDIGRKKEQLLYLAQLLKFEVQFSDFPKGNHGEYLTLVILSTEPPQLCHGSGASLQESHDEAARGALEILSKIGLDNVKPKAATSNGTDSVITAVTTRAATADTTSK